MKSIKRILATALVLAMVFTLLGSTFTASAAAKVTCTNELVVVDDDFAGLAKGTVVSATVAGTEYQGRVGTTAFATLQSALANVAVSGKIYVAAGVYSGKVEITQMVEIYGNKKDVNPNDAHDITLLADGRGATGENESILQDMQIGYKALAIGDTLGAACSLTLNGFAMDGDSCIRMQGDRLNNAAITVTNTVFDIVNDKAYGILGVEDNVFSALNVGQLADLNFMAANVTFSNNRVERVTSASGGITDTSALTTVHAGFTVMENNYIANVTDAGFSISMPGANETKVVGNYITNVGRNRIYDGIRGSIIVSDNTFDTVSGAYALGLYADAAGANYNSTWYESTTLVQVNGNTFRKLEKAIRLYGRLRLADKPINNGPVGATIYENIFDTSTAADPTFIHMSYNAGLIAPPVFNNYTGTHNPKEICIIDNSAATATFDFGDYWLDEGFTVSSDVFDVTGIADLETTDSKGEQIVYSFSGAEIATAPDCIITASVPKYFSEVPIALTVAEGAYYELYEDAACTTELPDGTLSLNVGEVTMAYAKVYFGDYSVVYTIMLTRKENYTEYLDASEYMVDTAFSKYPSGTEVYVEVPDSKTGEIVLKRAQVGNSAFVDLTTAISKARSGDTIRVAAGEYPNAMTIGGKGVKILGAKAGINPTDTDDMTGATRNSLRSNLDNETVFTNEITLTAGVNGLTFDGVTFSGKGRIIFSGSFGIDGMQIKNLMTTGSTGTDSLFQRGRNDNGKNTLSNILFDACRFEGNGTSYVMRLPNMSTGLIENCAFVNCNKPFYMGGNDGTASDVLTFKENVFNNCVNNFLQIGDGSNAGARVKNSLAFIDNRTYGSSSGTLAIIRRWTSGNTLTVTGNRFESGRGGISIANEPGYSGQIINVNENYLGNATFTNNTESVANCAYNYSSKADPSSAYVGECIYLPYYLDAAMTKLYGAYEITAVTAPKGAVIDEENKTVTYTATEAADTMELALTVSDGATYAIYKDKACTEKLDNTFYLEGQSTTVYIKVTAVNGETNAVYTMNITQPANGGTAIYGVEVDGSSFAKTGSSSYDCYLPNSYVKGSLIPITSAGATVFVYAATDTEMKTPLHYNQPMDIPVGSSSYLVKVTSEDGKNSAVYTVTYKRTEKSDAAKILSVAGTTYEAEIFADTVIAAYSYETTKVLPEITVSDGATYDFFSDIGCNNYVDDPIKLAVGNNTLYAKVVAENGTSQTIYTFTLVREDIYGGKTILAESFPKFAASQAELEADATGELIGFKMINNADHRIYLQPKNILETLADEIVVCENAMYQVFTNYDPATGALSGQVSSDVQKKDIKLTEGTNIFYVRVNARNGSEAIYTMTVYNAIKNTESEIINVNNFAVSREGNVLNCSIDTENPAVDIFVSDKATVEVFADAKKRVPVKSSMGTYTVTDTGVVYTSCKLANPISKSYMVYFVDVTSETGFTSSYELRFSVTPAAREFKDASGHWAEKYIAEAYLLGITGGNGNPDGSFTFDPQDNATRQQVAVFITNLLGVDTSYYKNVKLPYKDAKSIASWAKNSVRAVTALEIMNGDGTNFNPKANISREEFMTVMVRAAALDTRKGTTSKLNRFTDKNTVSSWATRYVATAVAYGLVNGDEHNRINPKKPITRAELVKIMVCAKDYVR